MRNGLRGVVCAIGLWIACGVPAATAVAQPQADLADRVRAELATDPALAEQRIAVEAENGVVMLSGEVNHLLARRRALRVAETVLGVRSVVNRIQVNPPEGAQDWRVQNRVEEALIEHDAMQAYRVQITVENGVVTLDGEVDNWAEKDLAERLAAAVTGVTGVRNKLQVIRPAPVSDRELRTLILERLRWDALLAAEPVEARVDEGRVRLEGRVSSAAAKRRATELARQAGAVQLDASDLRVTPPGDGQAAQRRTLEPPTPAAVEEALRLALRYDPRVPAQTVDVAVTDERAAVLEGTVPNMVARQAAIEDARHTRGVREVVDRLSVQPPGEVPDEALAERVRQALRWNPYVAPYQVAVTVENGRVALAGRTETAFERQEAAQAAAAVPGVRDVANEIKIQRVRPGAHYEPYVNQAYPRALNPEEITSEETTAERDREIWLDVRDQLALSPWVDEQRVNVAVNNGVAVLMGTVDSLAARDAAVENAYDGGARRVETQLRVR